MQEFLGQQYSEVVRYFTCGNFLQFHAEESVSAHHCNARQNACQVRLIVVASKDQYVHVLCFIASLQQIVLKIFFTLCNSSDVYVSTALIKLIMKLECGPMPNLMVALPNIGGALCSTPQSLADADY